jgi:predicted RNA binding protein YcfA (HicA-like mRNA interferase family)
MRRLPRDVSGQDLTHLLKKYGYTLTRQTGSHIRLTTQHNGTHHLTILAHDPLRIGTLAAILADVAAHLQITQDKLSQSLFQKEKKKGE